MLSSPGCVTATFDTGSTRMSRIRSSDTTTPPSTALEPPDSPEPAPRGTTGIRCLAAQVTVAWTSAVRLAPAEAHGPPAGGAAAARAGGRAGGGALAPVLPVAGNDIRVGQQRPGGECRRQFAEHIGRC